jgi:aspartokinase
MTIAEAVRHYVETHPFIEEGLSDGIINYAGLARNIQPAIQTQCTQTVRDGAIIMALKRLSPSYYYQVSAGIKKFLSRLGQFTVRYDIVDYTYQNSTSLIGQQENVFRHIAKHPEFFYSFSQGLSESTIVASKHLHPYILDLFADEQMLAHKKELAALTIMLPKDNTEISGIYYFIFKELAWQDINIVEVISTTHEITLVVAESDVEESFRLVRRLKSTQIMKKY